MADKDADAASATQAASTQLNTTHVFTFSTVNNPPLPTAASVSTISKTPPQGTTRMNGVSAKRSSAESQPMSATSSSSSNPVEQRNGNPVEGNGTSPYGTRSRNRNGHSRPNYAEDRDPDMDFEFTSNKKGSAAASQPPAHVNDIDKSGGSNTRRSSNPMSSALLQSSKILPPNVSKDTLPGMSSFPLNPEMPNVASAPAPSRKRKAPGANPTSHASTTTTQTPSAVPSRRTASGAAAVASGRAVNLMTFENCRGYLKNGKLRADDGTTISVDGQCDISLELPTFHHHTYFPMFEYLLTCV